MTIIQFAIGIFLGWVTGSIATIPITVLRFGIPMCNILIKNKEDVEALKLLRKRYLISLIIWMPIITLITFLCFKFLDKGIYGFVVSWAFIILIGFKSTGKTENNLLEFDNSLYNCKEILETKNK